MNLFYTTMSPMEATGFSIKKIIINYSFILFIILLSTGQSIGQYSAPDSASTGSGGGTAVGQSAGNSSSTGNRNSFFGSSSGSNNTTGRSNAFFGQSAGRRNTTGEHNSFFGSESGDESEIGNGNSFFGSQTGFSNAGHYNSFFGNEAGHNNGRGSRNSFFGHFAGFENRGGNENTSVGFDAGMNIEDGDNNICIGANSGPTQRVTTSQRLYIDIEQSDNPLIYAEFDTNFVRINGTFEVTAGLSNPSDVNLKENFETVDVDDILNKVSGLDITKWNYKYLPGDNHIGTTAQEFRQAFNLGADDKHISTIDADGVALASIQALKKENDELRNLVKELAIRISKLEIANKN